MCENCVNMESFYKVLPNFTENVFSIGLQKDEDWNPEDRVRYNTHLRELVESVSVALARSVASALLWNTDYRRACPLARRGGLGSPGEVRAAAPVGGGA